MSGVRFEYLSMNTNKYVMGLHLSMPFCFDFMCCLSAGTDMEDRQTCSFPAMFSSQEFGELQTDSPRAVYVSVLKVIECVLGCYI